MKISLIWSKFRGIYVKQVSTAGHKEIKNAQKHLKEDNEGHKKKKKKRNNS